LIHFVSVVIGNSFFKPILASVVAGNVFGQNIDKVTSIPPIPKQLVSAIESAALNTAV
jgi:hypothetical protein